MFKYSCFCNINWAKRTDILVLIFCLFLTASCSDESLDQDCIQRNVTRKGMSTFKGEDLGCNDHLNLYIYQNKLYFQVENNCAYIIQKPFNCYGVYLCEDEGNNKCQDYFEKRNFIRTVGIAYHTFQGF